MVLFGCQHGIGTASAYHQHIISISSAYQYQHIISMATTWFHMMVMFGCPNARLAIALEALKLSRRWTIVTFLHMRA
jgi:hypothetical protein